MNNNISVTNKFINKLIIVAEQNKIIYDSFEGTLNDNYIFYDTEILRITGVERAKYIIIKEVYLNEWSSDLQLFVTDDIKEVDKFREQFEYVA